MKTSTQENTEVEEHQQQSTLKISLPKIKHIEKAYHPHVRQRVAITKYFHNIN